MKAQKAWSIIYWSGDENNVWNVEKKKKTEFSLYEDWSPSIDIIHFIWIIKQ